MEFMRTFRSFSKEKQVQLKGHVDCVTTLKEVTVNAVTAKQGFCI